MDSETMNFSEALEWLKQGKMVTRQGWNGKGMYIFLQTSANENIELPYLRMKTAYSKLVPWLASQTDLLANDWVCIS